jgi:hypothetical protein
MRILLAIPLLLVAACNVDHDDANNQVVFNYDEEAAQNMAEDVGNVGEDIGNEAEDVVNTLQNTDVDVDVSTNGQ